MQLRVAVRCARVLVHVLKGLCICTFAFPWLDRDQRLAHIGRWSAQLLRIFRVSVELTPGSPAPTDGLWVANHVSWMDVFVIDALYPSRFVAKSEVRRWPLIGALSARAGTVFVARGQRRALRDTVTALAAALAAGERVVVFPEGTSAAQGALLPFRANLFEAAVMARTVVQPVALRYLDPSGHLHKSVEYIGDMSFLESMASMLSGAPIRAVVVLAPALPSGGAERRDLAQRAHAAVNDMLAGRNRNTGTTAVVLS